MRWSATLGEGRAAEVLNGGTQLWGINHYSSIKEWRFLNKRETDERLGGQNGPAQESMSQTLAPGIAAKLQLAVQKVMGELIQGKVDPAMLQPPAKPKPAPKPSLRKGTVDYSKWDDLSDEESGSRIQEIS